MRYTQCPALALLTTLLSVSSPVSAGPSAPEPGRPQQRATAPERDHDRVDGQSASPSTHTRLGSIEARLVDLRSRAPLPGAEVEVVGTTLRGTTDAEGRVVIEKVPVGSYTVRFGYPDVVPVSRTDVIVKSNRATVVQAELELIPIHRETVVVEGRYFAPATESPVSSVAFSAEEIRRAPGSAGDVSRLLQALPSVAKVDDTSNSLVVRGGNPAENIFLIDNIEIPNINHFPMPGTSGGPISLLNTEFLEDVKFSSGGFPAMFGDRLSSVMDVTFREGRRQKALWQADLSIAGFGGTGEGPLPGGHGSWLLSVRRSYLDILADAISGGGVVPRYSDIQGKVVIDLPRGHRLSVLGVAGDDRTDMSRDDALESGDDAYGRFSSREGTIGANWFASWSRTGYSNTSVSYSATRFRAEFSHTDDQALMMDNTSWEKTLAVRHATHLTLGHGISTRVGGEIKRVDNDYDYVLGARTSVVGLHLPETRTTSRAASWKHAMFGDVTLALGSRLTLTPGLRYDHFSFTGNDHLSPRLSAGLALSAKDSINASAGVYHQTLPLILLYQQPAFRNLRDPRAVHYTAGYSHLLAPDVRLTIEGYAKEYRHLPADPTEPSLSVFDDLYGMGFMDRSALTDTGVAYTRGVEVMLQKRLKSHLYGLISGSLFRSRYRGLDGAWRDREFDNRYIATLEGGYRPNRSWELSTRWILAGGRPYTPFDIEASRAANSAVLDTARTNAARSPAYHSLNLRIDRRWYPHGSNVTLYVDLWNVYDRRNLAYYYWNETAHRVDRENQFPIMPIVGVQWEF